MFTAHGINSSFDVEISARSKWFAHETLFTNRPNYTIQTQVRKRKLRTVFSTNIQKVLINLGYNTWSQKLPVEFILANYSDNHVEIDNTPGSTESSITPVLEEHIRSTPLDIFLPELETDTLPEQDTDSLLDPNKNFSGDESISSVDEDIADLEFEIPESLEEAAFVHNPPCTLTIKGEEFVTSGAACKFELRTSLIPSKIQWHSKQSHADFKDFNPVAVPNPLGGPIIVPNLDELLQLKITENRNDWTKVANPLEAQADPKRQKTE